MVAAYIWLTYRIAPKFASNAFPKDSDKAYRIITIVFFPVMLVFFWVYVVTSGLWYKLTGKNK